MHSLVRAHMLPLAINPACYCHSTGRPQLCWAYPSDNEGALLQVLVAPEERLDGQIQVCGHFHLVCGDVTGPCQGAPPQLEKSPCAPCFCKRPVLHTRACMHAAPPVRLNQLPEQPHTVTGDTPTRAFNQSHAPSQVTYCLSKQFNVCREIHTYSRACCCNGTNARWHLQC